MPQPEGWTFGEQMLTPQEVADVLKVSTATVARLRRNGDLAAARVGGRYRFPAAALERFVNSQAASEPVSA